jgi:hypothetical protein
LSKIKVFSFFCLSFDFFNKIFSKTIPSVFDLKFLMLFIRFSDVLTAWANFYLIAWMLLFEFLKGRLWDWNLTLLWLIFLFNFKNNYSSAYFSSSLVKKHKKSPINSHSWFIKISWNILKLTLITFFLPSFIVEYVNCSLSLSGLPIVK